MEVSSVQVPLIFSFNVSNFLSDHHQDDVLDIFGSDYLRQQVGSAFYIHTKIVLHIILLLANVDTGLCK